MGINAPSFPQKRSPREYHCWGLLKITFPRRTMVDGGQGMNLRRWDGRMANHEKLSGGQLTTKLIPPPPYIYFQILADN
jgi:hypothetical protein